MIFKMVGGEKDEEIEVIDVSLNEHEIDEMIAQLVKLKEHKESVQIPIAADLDLSVSYDKVQPENSEDDDGDDDNPDGEDVPDEGSEKMEGVA